MQKHIFFTTEWWSIVLKELPISSSWCLKTHLFFLSSRLDTWELPRIWTSGLKPLFSFFTLFARRGNINPFFDGICVVSWRPVLFCFFRRFFALKRQAESKGWHRHCVSTWSFSRAPKLVYRFACLSNLLFWFELAQTFSVISRSHLASECLSKVVGIRLS